MNRPRGRIRLQLKRKVRRDEMWNLAGSLVGLCAVLVAYCRFIHWVELRPGVRLDDPLLTWLPRGDLAYLIFAFVYGAMILSLSELWGQWLRLASALRSYAILVVFRMTAMYLLPLESPTERIALRDPLVALFGSTGGAPPTRDLFFSGHVATVFLLFLVSREKSRCSVLGLTSLLLAFAVLIQRADYSVDVIAAPFFAYGAYKIEGLLFERLGPRN